MQVIKWSFLVVEYLKCKDSQVFKIDIIQFKSVGFFLDVTIPTKKLYPLNEKEWLD